jgi:arylsulfatase A-like enzyme
MSKDRNPARSMLLAGAWALLALACGREPAVGPAHMQSPAAQRPNVLILVLDTLRPDHLGCYGSARPTSPRLDSLAQRSCVFENAQSAAPLTVASILTLVTSLYPEVHGVQGALNPGRMSEHVSTLAEVLAGAGYATAAFTEGGYANPQFGLGQGFQVFPAHPEDLDPDVTNLLGTSRLAGNLERALAWLRQERHAPFFLLFHTYEIHAPNFARDEYVRPFRPGFDEQAERQRAARAIERWNREHQAGPEECQQLLEQLYQSPPEGLPRLEDPDGFAKLAHFYHCAPEDALENDKLLALVRDLYDASIRYTDDQLEQLWQALDELRLADDTLVVVVSDHGEGLGEHHELEHSNVLHEEALRVVLMIHVPGREFAPRRIAAQVRTVDLLPTVLELLGVDARGLALQGRSLVPLMRGEQEPERVAFSHARRVDEFQNPQYTVRAGGWRLIDEPKAGKRWLYDLAHDPKELMDVAAQHPDVVARLAGLLAQQAKQDAFLREKIGSAPGELVIDEQTLEELRALGYAGKGPK